MHNKYKIFPIYGLTFIILLLPVTLNDFLPLIDISNHIARHYIASSISDDINLNNFYSYTFTGFGNSTSDLIRSIIGKYISSYDLVRITLGFYMVNFVFSVCVLYRAIKGHWGLWPLSSALLVFNGNFLWGFENYLIGAPFFLYAIAALIYSDRYAFMRRFMIISAFTVLLSIFHILLGLVFGVAILGYELQRTFAQPLGARLRYFLRSLSLGLPFILCIGFYISSPSSTDNIDGSYTSFGSIHHRLDGLTSISSMRYHHLFTDQTIWETAIFLTFMFALVMLLLRTGPRLVIEERVQGILKALLLTSILMPAWVDGVAFVQFRTPFLLAAVFIASVKFIDFPKQILAVIYIAIAIIFGGRLYTFQIAAHQHSTDITALNQLLKKLPVGAKLMPLFGEKNSNKIRYHNAAFAVVERQVLIPTLFQGMHGLKVNASWKDFAAPVPAIKTSFLTFDKSRNKYVFHKSTPYLFIDEPTYYYDTWEEKFTHILLINETDIPLEARLPLAKIGSSGAFTLYENTELK